jgi:hypothetical protein
MMRRVIPMIGLMLLVAGLTPVLAATLENTPITDQSMTSTQTYTFGPFSNFGGTNKNFRLSGSVDILNANTDVNVRYLWHPVASATAPQAASQWFKASYPASGTSQALDTGTKLLVGLCPQTVWVQVKVTKSINTHGWSYEHTCNVSDVGQQRIAADYSLPGTSPWGLVILGFALATVAAFVLYRSRRTWSDAANA